MSLLLLWLSYQGTAAAECNTGNPVDAHYMVPGRGAQTPAPSAHARTNCTRELPVRSLESSHPEDANRWSAASALSAANVATEHSRDTEYETPVERSLSEVRWADSHDWIHNPPEWVQQVKNYRKQGMPIVHLMQSKETSIALGIGNHGKPGLYFTHKLPF
jgi:hypothetical protein